MKVGIIGGTGGMGKGFAIRWCKDHNVLIGSRDAERANTSAQEYSELTKEAYGSVNGNITGTDNTTVAKECGMLHAGSANRPPPRPLADLRWTP